MPSLYLLSVIAVMVGAIVLSFTGLIMRQIDSADVWQVLFYRAIGMIATMTIFVAFTQRGKLLKGIRDAGWRGVVVAFLIGPSFGFYILALTLSSVAEVSFVISTLPLFTALLAWIFLKEKIGLLTWLVIVIVLCGVALMVFDSLGQGGEPLGILVAFAVPITFAGTIVLIRSWRDVDMVPATWMAGFVALGMALVLSGSNFFTISNWDMLFSLLMGCTLGLGFGLYTIGTRYVSAAQVALLALLEQVFNPVWAWAGAGETPTTLVLIGGIIVLSAVTFKALQGVREERIKTLSFRK